ncbi:MAG: alkaline phosphatase family protein [Clostridia bacterium]|nr:alkaline phosphatase family protein [Clostridia bacterium]
MTVENKVVMILLDGMRPDGMMNCGNPEVNKLLSESRYSLKAQTVWPSVTLPCHMSLFHSVDPDRHGTTDNIYMRQVRPVKGLFEMLHRGDPGLTRKKSAMFYSWEELRDLCRFDRLDRSLMINLHTNEDCDEELTDEAIKYIKDHDPDFVFLYLGNPDETGHKFGWMSEEYLKSISKGFDRVAKVKNVLSPDHTLIVLADHGGHGRSHGTTEPEDMTIPVIIRGKDFAPGEFGVDVNIKDVAPTVAKLLGAQRAPEWEGKELF